MTETSRSAQAAREIAAAPETIEQTERILARLDEKEARLELDLQELRQERAAREAEHARAAALIVVEATQIRYSALWRVRFLDGDELAVAAVDEQHAARQGAELRAIMRETEEAAEAEARAIADVPAVVSIVAVWPHGWSVSVADLEIVNVSTPTAEAAEARAIAIRREQLSAPAAWSDPLGRQPGDVIVALGSHEGPGEYLMAGSEWEVLETRPADGGASASYLVRRRAWRSDSSTVPEGRWIRSDRFHRP
jgi:hypothetical protein